MLASTIPTQKYWKIKKSYTNECKNETFEKLKSNTVAEDSSVRLQIINNKKSISNNPTSNIKFQTSNAAITLIALIITIIVLLILAGVTLNMVMGENGIINKAQLAKEKTNEAQEQENKMLNELEQQIDSYTRSEGSNSVSIYKLSELDSTYNPYGLKGFVKYDKSNELLEVNLYDKQVNIPNLTQILNLDFIENLPTLNLEGQDVYVKPETADYMAGTGMTVNSGWTGAFLSLSTNKNIYIHNTNGATITEIGPFHCEMYLK